MDCSFMDLSYLQKEKKERGGVGFFSLKMPKKEKEGV